MHGIVTMCRVLGVSASGYWAWRKRPMSEREKSDRAIEAQIAEIHHWSRGTYGVPRIHAELAARGTRVGRKRVARLMRRAGLQGVTRRKGTFTTVRDADARPAPDLVDRNFVATAADRLWVADITYIPTWAGFLYLAVVLDAWSRRVVGWAMETHLRTRAGAPGLEYGALPATARRGDSSLRPGLPVHFDCLRQALRGGRRASLDGLGRRCLR